MKELFYKNHLILLHEIIVLLKNNGLYLFQEKKGIGKSTFFKALNGEIQSKTSKQS